MFNSEIFKSDKVCTTFQRSEIICSSSERFKHTPATLAWLPPVWQESSHVSFEEVKANNPPMWLGRHVGTGSHVGNIDNSGTICCIWIWKKVEMCEHVTDLRMFPFLSLSLSLSFSLSPHSGMPLMRWTSTSAPSTRTRCVTSSVFY